MFRGKRSITARGGQASRTIGFRASATFLVAWLQQDLTSPHGFWWCCLSCLDNGEKNRGTIQNKTKHHPNNRLDCLHSSSTHAAPSNSCSPR
ncbi:hypothetical protein VTJ04DRAFT_6197 [Mycothermus thermophilus]|uniref:uncharacterized protein n=1 Tax=Humicola insolens TaxID=85995 RepID=UPI0037445E3D